MTENPSKIVKKPPTKVIRIAVLTRMGFGFRIKTNKTLVTRKTKVERKRVRGSTFDIFGSEEGVGKEMEGGRQVVDPDGE